MINPYVLIFKIHNQIGICLFVALPERLIIAHEYNQFCGKINKKCFISLCNKHYKLYIINSGEFVSLSIWNEIT